MNVACVRQLLSCVWLFATPWTVPARILCPWDSPGKKTGVGSVPFSRGSSQPELQADSLLSEPQGSHTGKKKKKIHRRHLGPYWLCDPLDSPPLEVRKKQFHMHFENWKIPEGLARACE